MSRGIVIADEKDASLYRGQWKRSYDRNISIYVDKSLSVFVESSLFAVGVHCIVCKVKGLPGCSSGEIKSFGDKHSYARTYFEEIQGIIYLCPKFCSASDSYYIGLYLCWLRRGR